MREREKPSEVKLKYTRRKKWKRNVVIFMKQKAIPVFENVTLDEVKIEDEFVF